ncbi:MAG: diphosphate--fructose-6-phosphate 1-phosphotransferase [Parachlamydiales bacterium]|jgi:pyrophosphate--fructose-6-phosphate 1-phosphotransferase
MPGSFSPLASARLKYQPRMPGLLKALPKLQAVGLKNKVKTDPGVRPFFSQLADSELVEFKRGRQIPGRPLKVGVFFSGGQAPGGHNVVSGLFDALKKIHPQAQLVGFLGGPSGLVEGKTKAVVAPALKFYRNQGGFDFLGSGRTKIETEEQLEAALACVRRLDLDGLVVVGGDDSNTNAALMAEYFLKHKAKTKVVGIPKTIDGDLRSFWIENSFGFDTATKVYSELIGNIAKDALSAKKYYHFIKLMGRSASHVTLECALKTQVNFAFIAEEIRDRKLSLKELIDGLCRKIEKRIRHGKNYGVVLIPEGLIEFIPEVKRLIGELNRILASDSSFLKVETPDSAAVQMEKIQPLLSASSRLCFQQMPRLIQTQLLCDRDPHGNVQVSQIETEKLIMELVFSQMKARGLKFKAQAHFLGYEGRSALPTNFDADYCYSLGFLAAALIQAGKTGYMAALKGLKKFTGAWQPFGVPLVSLMKLEERKGQKKPVVQKALVDLKGRDFQLFCRRRLKWENADDYLCPGPIQF